MSFGELGRLNKLKLVVEVSLHARSLVVAAVICDCDCLVLCCN